MAVQEWQETCRKAAGAEIDDVLATRGAATKAATTERENMASDVMKSEVTNVVARKAARTGWSR